MVGGGKVIVGPMAVRTIVGVGVALPGRFVIVGVILPGRLVVVGVALAALVAVGPTVAAIGGAPVV